jgi:hypothetical protein
MLSGIISVLASQPISGQGQAALGNGFVPSTTSIALPTNQGPQGVNLALMPTGTLTPRQLKREQYVATFKGPYTIGPGRTSTEAEQIYIRGAGGSNQMLHSDIQMRIIVPQDPTTQLSGVTAIFDRNINSNSTLGLDLDAPRQNVDSSGRPNLLSPSLDANISSGTYVEGFSQGQVSIHYSPSGKHAPGVIQQGTATIKIRAQIYTLGVAFILANSDLNPGGPSQGGPHAHAAGGSRK